MNEWMNEWLGYLFMKFKEIYFVWMCEVFEVLMILEFVIFCFFLLLLCLCYGLFLFCWYWICYIYIFRWYVIWIIWSLLDLLVLMWGFDFGIVGFGWEVLSCGYLCWWIFLLCFLDWWSCWVWILFDLVNGFGFVLVGGSVLGVMLVNLELEMVGLVESWWIGGGGVE